MVAVESSGDQISARFVKAYKEIEPTVQFAGTGGPEMAALGLQSNIDISDLAVLGFVEALKVYATVLDRVQKVSDHIFATSPDAVILVDSWGFMIRVAKALKSRGYKGKIIKYVAPQVWAMREGRAKILARYVDDVLTIQSFDAPFFEKQGLPVHYVGNPIFETDYRGGDAGALRKTLNLSAETPIVAVLFGSRLSEIQTLAKPFTDAVELIRSKRPDVVFVSAVSDAIATDVAAAAGADLRMQDIILLPEARKLDVFASSLVALTCSGTVTTQLASAGIPSVVAYKLNPLTYIFAKYLYKPDYISIVNVAANRALMPEFVQAECNGPNLANAVLSYLDDTALRAKTSHDLMAQTERMKGEGRSGARRAAEAVRLILKVRS